MMMSSSSSSSWNEERNERSRTENTTPRREKERKKETSGGWWWCLFVVPKRVLLLCARGKKTHKTLFTTPRRSFDDAKIVPFLPLFFFYLNPKRIKTLNIRANFFVFFFFEREKRVENTPV